MIYRNKIEKGLFGWVSKIKDRMYRTITPRGYHIGQSDKEYIKGDTRDMSKFTPLENEVWARYLGAKYEGPSNLEPATYRPTKGGATYNDVVKLKDESQILSDNVLKLLLDNYKKTGKKSMLVKGSESGLGTYTISMGEDKNGKYISYYDDWDINPTRGISAKYNIPILNLIGDIVPGTHPFSVYGRRYYKNGGLIRKLQTGSPIHYSRTMTTDNLSKAANYVGEHILKGLGTFGKFLNAGFTSPTYGTTGQVSYARNAEDAKRLREQSEASEQAMGKAMTWVSPLNYGAALATGNGLNARKGEEEVSSWSPAWQAVGRLGELYFGPKAVKGASRVAINTAARAGVKPAKAAVIAREINKGVNKNTPKYDNRIHSIRVDNLIYDYSSNPLLEFVNTIKTSPTNSYFMRAPSKIDITKLHNGRFRHEVVGNNILSSGEVDGKFVSYGEPWKEFGFGEGSALYEFPVGPKRGPNMMATDWKGRNKDYSVNEAYDYMKLEELLREDLRLLNKQMGELFDKNYATIRNNLIEAKYPLLKLHIDTSIHGGNQTVIPNLKWNFNNFLNSPFYKYTIDPISNQVQKELVISGVPNKSVEPSTSLAFFERKPSKISKAEKAGATKLERNFKTKWHVANYPGYLLKGLMKGSLLEKQLSKSGTININLLNAYFNKASQIEKEVANKVLAEKFAGQKTIDYNLFKKAVLDELIGKYNRVPLTKYADYGMDRLGLAWDIRLRYELLIKDKPEILQYWEYNPNTLLFTIKTGPNKGLVADPELFYGDYFKSILPKLNTFTFESPRILQGSDKHYDTGTLGHSRTYTTSDEPKILHVMESLSDWSQEGIAKTNEAYRQKLINNPESYNKRINSLLRMNEELKDWESIVRTEMNHGGIKLLPWEIQQIQQEFIPNLQKNILNLKSKLEGNPLALHLSNNYLQRQLQENLRYAAENGLTKMRYPTSETAAKIEGYPKQSPSHVDENIIEQFWNDNKELQEINWRDYYNGNINSLSDYIIKTVGLDKYNKFLDRIGNSIYSPQHQTILKKYADFPKLFLKLFKDLQVKTVTDAKGNTWYEVDVPKGYLSREWLFKQVGKMNAIEQFKEGHKIHIKKKNRGKFTAYCGGNVTSACIAKAKASGNPTLVKRATFAANARKWKHLKGGKLCLIPRN